MLWVHTKQIIGNNYAYRNSRCVYPLNICDGSVKVFYLEDIINYRLWWKQEKVAILSLINVLHICINIKYM